MLFLPEVGSLTNLFFDTELEIYLPARNYLMASRLVGGAAATSVALGEGKAGGLLP